MNTIKEIENWYSSQCNGDWEHGKGLELTTIDNPGWRLKINLVDTGLESRPFQRLEVERSESDWFQCWVKDAVFEAACGSKNLEDVLKVFIKWAKAHT
jgi:hypothetical protein